LAYTKRSNAYYSNMRLTKKRDKLEKDVWGSRRMDLGETGSVLASKGIPVAKNRKKWKSKRMWRTRTKYNAHTGGGRQTPSIPGPERGVCRWGGMTEGRIQKENHGHKKNANNPKKTKQINTLHRKKKKRKEKVNREA